MKSISEIIKIMDFNSVEIVEYTQKCIAVIGATKPIKDDLKALRGKWNSNLTINGASSGGWIFPLTRRDDVVAMLIRLKFKTKEEEEEEEEEEETQKRMDRQRKKEKAERKQKRAERRAERQRKTEEEEEEDQQKIADEHKLFFLSVVMWMISMLIIMGNYINQKSMSKEMILV
jgi:Skp family chaperone for outer membrane proteins